MKDIITRQDVIDMLMSENKNEPRYPDYYASKVEEIEEVSVLYSCDQKRCGVKCSWPTCQLTTDPEHAVGYPILVDNQEIEPKRPQGYWIFKTDVPIGGGRTSAGYVCSYCGKDYFRVDGMNFCPRCGARMGGEDRDH